MNAAPFYEQLALLIYSLNKGAIDRTEHQCAQLSKLYKGTIYKGGIVFSEH